MGNTATEIDEQVWQNVDISDLFTARLILFNDEVNSFEHVIVTLCEVLHFPPERAEQIAWLVHTKGKCQIKEGSMEELKPLHRTLGERGLTVEIQ